MEIDEKIKYWLELSDYDLETAGVMQKTKRYLYIGFMCHQVTEKILKAAYVLNKKSSPPYTHNLTLLAKESGVFPGFSIDQLEFIDLLEPLNVEARYPSYKDKLQKTLSDEKCYEILTQTREFQQWIKAKFLKK